MVNRLLTSLTAQQKRTTARLYSNKISLILVLNPSRIYKLEIEVFIQQPSLLWLLVNIVLVFQHLKILSPKQPIKSLLWLFVHMKTICSWFSLNIQPMEYRCFEFNISFCVDPSIHYTALCELLSFEIIEWN